MANLNKVLLMGNITRDLELKYMPNQTAVCDIGLAINRTWTGQDGVKKEEVTFVDCTAFGKQAEVLSKYKKKGDPLFVEGRLKLDQWDAQDGTKRYKMRVIIENFQFLNRGQGAPGAGGGGSYGAEDGGGYGGEAPAPRQQPRPAGNQPYRQAGRPGAAAPAQRPAAAPNYDAGDAPAPEEAPPLSDEDIPF
ncbi:MAG TPA: single-stranded DNA-binding protein [Phycisphaerae bacterium]|nr:single-stranded DNA-binding protein [Phycisphaerae bacterium]